MKTFDDLDNLMKKCNIVTVQGTNNVRDIFLFAISTCQWCKRGKKWLKSNEYRFRYIDIDKIPLSDKRMLKADLKEIFSTRLAFPFIVVDGVKYYSGFDETTWKDLIVY